MQISVAAVLAVGEIPPAVPAGETPLASVAVGTLFPVAGEIPLAAVETLALVAAVAVGIPPASAAGGEIPPPGPVAVETVAVAGIPLVVVAAGGIPPAAVGEIPHQTATPAVEVDPLMLPPQMDLTDPHPLEWQEKKTDW